MSGFSCDEREWLVHMLSDWVPLDQKELRFCPAFQVHSKSSFQDLATDWTTSLQLCSWSGNLLTHLIQDVPASWGLILLKQFLSQSSLELKLGFLFHDSNTCNEMTCNWEFRQYLEDVEWVVYLLIYHFYNFCY